MRSGFPMSGGSSGENVIGGMLSGSLLLKFPFLAHMYRLASGLKF